jgi:hypothetical protein
MMLVIRAWPDIVLRPVVSSVEMRYAIAYCRDRHSPVLVRFLKIVRQIARNQQGPVRS